MRGLRRVAFAWAAAVGFASPALAFDPGIPALPVSEKDAVTLATNDSGPAAIDDSGRGGIFDEIRLGGSLHLRGDGGDWTANVPAEEDGAFVQGEILFDPLWDRRSDNVFLDALLRPRPHLGATVSADDGTNQLFGGVTWQFPLGSVLFVEASFGGTIHDGELNQPPGTTELSLGCRVLFRESAGVGLNLGRNWRVVGFVDHSSHAGLCDDANAGITHAGGMLGYRF